MYGKHVELEAQRHAIFEFPNESCGFVIDNHYIPMLNIADNPTETFQISNQDYFKALQRGLKAVVHSHPNGPAHPTKEDMRQQAASDIPWGIVATNGERSLPIIWFGTGKELPLEGREFIHGCQDCFGLIRSFYRQEYQVDLPDYFRDNLWWEHGENMYLDNYKEAGFRNLVDGEEPQRGDMFLACIRSKVPNHGGIYLGDGRILHHLQDKLSIIETASRWMKFVSHWMRHETQDNTTR